MNANFKRGGQIDPHFVGGIRFAGGEIRREKGMVELELDAEEGLTVMTPEVASNLLVALQFFFLEYDGAINHSSDDGCF
jgi:hypothetical protein